MSSVRSSTSGVHSIQSDRGHVLGLLLVEQGSSSSKGKNFKANMVIGHGQANKRNMVILHFTGWPGSHHGADDDHPDQLGECGAAQDLLHEVDRHLLVRLLLHGLRGLDRVRLCWLHRQEDSVEEEQVGGKISMTTTKSKTITMMT